MVRIETGHWKERDVSVYETEISVDEDTSRKGVELSKEAGLKKDHQSCA